MQGKPGTGIGSSLLKETRYEPFYVRSGLPPRRPGYPGKAGLFPRPGALPAGLAALSARGGGLCAAVHLQPDGAIPHRFPGNPLAAAVPGGEGGGSIHGRLLHHPLRPGRRPAFAGGCLRAALPDSGRSPDHHPGASGHGAGPAGANRRCYLVRPVPRRRHRRKAGQIRGHPHPGRPLHRQPVPGHPDPGTGSTGKPEDPGDWKRPDGTAGRIRATSVRRGGLGYPAGLPPRTDSRPPRLHPRGLRRPVGRAGWDGCPGQRHRQPPLYLDGCPAGNPLPPAQGGCGFGGAPGHRPGLRRDCARLRHGRAGSRKPRRSRGNRRHGGNRPGGAG